jgi:virulence factor BrkB
MGDVKMRRRIWWVCNGRVCALMLSGLSRGAKECRGNLFSRVVNFTISPRALLSFVKTVVKFRRIFEPLFAPAKDDVIASSFAFKLYITNFADYTATCGAIGGAIVATLWFYVSGLAIQIGAELNGVIEDSWRASRSDPTGAS